jgi:hypothetical protein
LIAIGALAFWRIGALGYWGGSLGIIVSNQHILDIPAFHF